MPALLCTNTVFGQAGGSLKRGKLCLRFILRARRTDYFFAKKERNGSKSLGTDP
jgi:hypothetical protein